MAATAADIRTRRMIARSTDLDASSLIAGAIDAVLKRDVFSTIERGRFRDQRRRSRSGAAPDRRACRGGRARWRGTFCGARRARWKSPARSASRLACCAPGRTVLVRGFIDGVAMHVARPEGDAAYFRSAKAALRALHRAGICHNDLAKEQNWLRGPDGRAYITDFQLATRFARPRHGCSGSAPTRICATCSSTSAATRRKR